MWWEGGVWLEILAFVTIMVSLTNESLSYKQIYKQIKINIFSIPIVSFINKFITPTASFKWFEIKTLKIFKNLTFYEKYSKISFFSKGKIMEQSSRSMDQIMYQMIKWMSNYFTCVKHENSCQINLSIFNRYQIKLEAN